MHIHHTKFIYCALFLTSAFLTACGGGGGGAAPAATTYTVGGTIAGGGGVTGLNGSGLVLRNGTENLPISANGNFVFTTPVTSGATYDVTVSSQPTGQTCTVNPTTQSGTVGSVNITSVSVTCNANAYTIGGTVAGGGGVTGLNGSGLVLRNGTENLPISANGNFVFTTPVTSGATYDVTVSSQPTGQTCTVNPTTQSGTVGSVNITSVSVTCNANAYTIGGTVAGGGGVTGLNGSGLVLRNGTENLPISANGNFVFTTLVASGAGYAVTVYTQPTGQRCTVTSGGTGSNVTANVTNVAVNCVNVFTVSATVSGYAPSIGLILQNTGLVTGADKLSITTDGTFAFSKELATGEGYNVKVLIQPAAPAKTCTVTGGTDTMAVSPVSVTITCAPPIPQFAYVANYNSNDVSAYSIASGALTPIGSNVLAGIGPSSITVVPSGKFAYVANYGIGIGSGDISAYTIGVTGALTQINCGSGTACNNASPSNGANYLAGGNPSAVSVDPSGQFAYVVNANDSNISAYTINPATGALTAIAGSPFLAGANPASITIDHTGKFAYVVNANDSNISAYTINQTTGALTLIACGGGAACDTLNGFPDKFPAGAAPKSLDIDPTSKFAYVANKGEGSVSAYKIETTGALTPIDADAVTPGIQNFLAGGEPSSIACDPTGRYVYVANRTSAPTGSISAYSINATTGALTPIGTPFAAGVQPVSITVDLSGQYVYVANNGIDSLTPPYYVSAHQIAGDGSLSAIISSPFTAGTNPASVITTVVY